MAVASAILSSGRDCIDLGVATTPTVELMVEHAGAVAGIVVTASHNPVEWNALKFLDERGLFLDRAHSDRLYRSFRKKAFSLAPARRWGRLSRREGSAAEHRDGILALSLVDAASVRKRGFKVVLDCINGAGSVAAPLLLEALGVRTVCINCKADGDFYRDPEPRPENLGDLARKVREQGADLGFALDPDADRLALVDPVLGPLSEEYTLALAADYVLGRKKGTMVVNASTSALAEVVARKHGARVYRTPVGEAHVVEEMLKRGSVVGGEGNGGVILPELHPGRDGLVGMALVLQFLAASGKTLSELVASYPSFHILKEKVRCRGPFDPEAILPLIEAREGVKIDRTDGVKVIEAEGWYHLRLSNTEGVVRIIAEARDRAGAQAMVDKAKGVLERLWEG